MSTPSGSWDERTWTLAVEEVTVGLSRVEREELFARVDHADLEAIERAVVALTLASLGELESPPAELQRRVRADARAHFEAQALLTGPRTPMPGEEQVARAAPARDAHIARRSSSSWLALAGWVAAAVILAIFWLRELSEHAPNAAQRRERLLAGADGLVRAAWVATADPLAGAISGDVVWSSARQEGYMRFHSLAPNDARLEQYQLWIFDSSRNDWEAKPVDGGVFDVHAGEEVVVPIDAKLEVRRPALFAVTLEPPGGVVVSQRQHLLATATP